MLWREEEARPGSRSFLGGGKRRRRR